jgi:hypothetical protein
MISLVSMASGGEWNEVFTQQMDDGHQLVLLNDMNET